MGAGSRFKLLALAALVLGLALRPGPALAWWSRGGIFFGGPPVVLAPGPYYYAPPPPPPPPIVYAPPPPVVYAPPPVAYAQSCYAGAYVCPLSVYEPAGANCSCFGNNGQAVPGRVGPR